MADVTFSYDQVLDELREAKRYYRDAPRCRLMLNRAMVLLAHGPETEMSKQMIGDLMFASRYAQVDPDVVLGYAAGAILVLLNEKAKG